MKAHDAAAVRGQGFGVTERLRLLQYRERIPRLRNFRTRLVIAREDEGERGVRAALVVLARRVEIAGPTPNVLAT